MQSQQDYITLEQGWGKMQEGFDKFIEIMEGGFREPFALSLHSELYTNCYAMCTQKAPNNYADQLYQKYAMIYETYLHATVLPAIKSKKGEAMLHEFAKRWKNHKLLVRQMWKLFVYLDRFYIKRISGLPLKAVGVQKFEQVVFNAVKEEVRAGILGMIEKEREGEDVDRELLKSVVNVFVEIGDWRPLFPTRVGEELGDIGVARFNIYNKELEQNLLATTSEFYARESAQWIATDSCPEYMKKVYCSARAYCSGLVGSLTWCMWNRPKTGCNRKSKGFTPTFTVSARKSFSRHATQWELCCMTCGQECENQLLAVHQTALLDKEETGCRALLREGKTEGDDDTSRMLPNSPDCGLQPISQIVREHIVDVGMSLVRKQEGEKDHSNYAQQLIELHDQYLALVNGPFGNNTLFQKVLKEAFEVFVNKDIGSTTTAELLSSFCDNIMKTGGDKIEGEIDSILDKIVMLFSYLSDKVGTTQLWPWLQVTSGFQDMFAEYYRKQLAKRLLLNRSASDDDERSLITKLKEFQDGQNNFTQWMKNNDINLGMECSVTVLTTGFWPTYKVDEVNLPNELVKCVDKFTQFYESRTSHRKLKWIHTLGTCVVLGRFDPKPIDLVISTYQACILMLYNQQEEYTTQDIANATKLPMEELKKYLQTLALSKRLSHGQCRYQILTKNPKGKEIADTDVFTFNRYASVPLATMS
eukprot:671639-Hanusia_phi.AAC.1